MSTFKDIIDTISGLKGDVATMIAGGKKFKSISKSSMDGTLNFPVIVSNALSIEDASLVSKALERQYASFTLTLMTMNPYLYTMGGKATAGDYVKKFHQNVDTRVDSTDIYNAATSFMIEVSNRYDIEYEALSEVSDRIVYKIYEGINHAGLNADNARVSYTITDVTESEILNNYANRRPVYEAKGGRPSATLYNTVRVDGVSVDDISVGDINIDVDASKIKLNSGEIGRGIGRAISRSGGSSGGGSRQQFNHMSVSSDYKKANELVPTLLHMRVYPIDTESDTEFPPIDFVLGIKATLHPVTSEEIVINIARGIRNENTFFNFIRWTTGEISF